VKKIEEFDREIVKQIFSTLVVMLLLFSLFLFFNDEIFQHSSKADNIMTKDAEKSIAVLPFKNLSLDPAQEYVSDGMTEEILSHLFMIGGLKITVATALIKCKALLIRKLTGLFLS